MKLPLACDVAYHEGFLSPSESAALFNWILANCDGLEAGAIVTGAGSTFRMETGKWMFVDQELTKISLLSEAYGERMAWPPLVTVVRDRVERHTGMQFAVCVCIYYPSGEVGVDFHSDLPAYGPVSVLPSISLGARREFLIRSKSNPSDQYGLELADGSLLIMGAGCQDAYDHSLPVNSKCTKPRINLTFREFTWPCASRSGR